MPEFEKALAQLQPAKCSEPVVSRFGVHLIQLMERREVGVEPRAKQESARTLIREQRSKPPMPTGLANCVPQPGVELRDAP